MMGFTAPKLYCDYSLPIYENAGHYYIIHRCKHKTYDIILSVGNAQDCHAPEDLPTLCPPGDSTEQLVKR